MIAGHLYLIGIFQASFMIADSLFDLRPAPLGLTVTRSYAQFSSQSFKGQRASANCGHDSSRLDASAQANLSQVF